MNHMFHSFLWRFVIIFFNDILIYSPTLEAHVIHLRLVFQILRAERLFLKQSKCTFVTSRVEYLGHFISQEGVSIGPSKV